MESSKALLVLLAVSNFNKIIWVYSSFFLTLQHETFSQDVTPLEILWKVCPFLPPAK